VRSLRALANISWLTARQMEAVAGAMTVTHHDKRSTIFSDKTAAESAHILLAGVARITCENRKGGRTTVIMLSPGLIPAFPTAVAGITYNFRCEAFTGCQVGTLGLNAFMKICLGIGAPPFKLMAASLLGRWDRVHLRCSNLIGCTLDERLALVLLDLTENFGVPNRVGGVRLTVSVRHHHLAELIGASRPRVSERLQEFMHKQLITQQDDGLVIDSEGLKSFLLEAQNEVISRDIQ